MNFDFLQRIFGRKDGLSTGKGQAIPLPDLPEWFERDNGLPYPQWKIIRAWLTRHLEPEGISDGYNQVVRLWLAKLAGAAGCGLNVSESTHFIMLSPFEAQGRKWALKVLEGARSSIHAGLGPLARSDGRGKPVVILLREDDYNLYISHYYHSDFMGRSAGVMLSGNGYRHIAAMAPEKRYPHETDLPLIRTLAHELTHLALCKKQLPRWLDEALAMSFEDQVAGSEPPVESRIGHSFEVIGTRAILREFAAWWTEERMQGFWSGALWNSEDDEQAFCYEMARTVFRILSQANHHAPVRVRAFITDASPEDGGEASARKHLGFSLGEAAADFLGEGAWEPQPFKW